MKNSTIAIPFTLALLLSPICRAESGYHVIKEIPTPNAASWNTLALDSSSRRLYAADAASVFVVDLDKEQVTRQLTNLVDVRCFIPVPKFKVAFYSAGDKASASGINLNTFKPAPSVKTSARPLAIVTDTNASLGFALCADGGGTVFEPDDGDLEGKFQLPAAPRSGVMDSKSRRVFCSLENGQVVVFGAATKVGALTTWSVAPGEKPSALAFDPTMQRLLVGCGNNLLVAMDTTSGKVVDSITVDSGADTIVFDSGSGQVFATNGKGKISVIQLLPQKMLVTGTLAVAPGSRCMAVDVKTRKLYVGTADGSKILVYGQ
jgi:DNA-binding beta-propeller fold protein YncE